MPPLPRPFGDLKVALQRDGWWPFLPNAMMAWLLLALGGGGVFLTWVLESYAPWAPWLLVWAPIALAALLAANLVFDLVTVRLGLPSPRATPSRRDGPDGLDGFDQLRARVSCRSFAPRPLRSTHHVELLSAAAHHSTAAERLGDQSVRLEYIQAHIPLASVVGAQEFLVAVVPRDVERTTVIDAARAMQHVVHHATGMGLATCWLGPDAELDAVEAALGDRFDDRHDRVLCVCAVGYASPFLPLGLRVLAAMQHHRWPMDELFGVDTSLPPYNAFGRCYEVCQWAPSVLNRQLARARLRLRDDEVERVDFFVTVDDRFEGPLDLGVWLANWEIGCEELGMEGHFVVWPHTTAAVALGSPTDPRVDVSWVRYGRRTSRRDSTRSSG